MKRFRIRDCFLGDHLVQCDRIDSSIHENSLELHLWICDPDDPDDHKLIGRFSDAKSFIEEEFYVKYIDKLPEN